MEIHRIGASIHLVRMRIKGKDWAREVVSKPRNLASKPGSVALKTLSMRLDW